MKILFMGTPDIASGCLQELIDKKYDIIGVVTQPDKQVGRGKKIVFSPVKQVAIENNLPVYQPIKAKEESFISFTTLHTFDISPCVSLITSNLINSYPLIYWPF